GSNEESSDVGSLGVIVYGYDGLPMNPVAPPSLDKVTGPEHLPSPDYVPGLEHPPSPAYVPKPKYPEYLVLSDVEAPIEDQPYAADASPTTLSLGHIADSDPEEDEEKDPANYPADGGDDNDDDESSGDDDDDDDVEEDKEEEEEHLALADSSVVPIMDLVPLAEDTEAFETDESASTPPTSPPHIILFSEIKPRTERMSIRPQKPIPFPHREEVERLLALPTPPPYPLTPLSSPLPQILSPPTTSPTYTEAPLGYRAAGIWLRTASLPLLPLG
ncbi:hypothetical protein Tco_1328260, partial [Tanacetum coccineum]